MINKRLLFPALSLLLSGVVLLQGCTLEPVNSQKTAPTTLSIYGVTVGGKINLPICDPNVALNQVKEQCIHNTTSLVTDDSTGLVIYFYEMAFPKGQEPKEWALPVGSLLISSDDTVISLRYYTKGKAVQGELLNTFNQLYGSKPQVYLRLTSGYKVVDERGEEIEIVPNEFAPTIAKLTEESIYAIWGASVKDAAHQTIIIELKGDVKTGPRKEIGEVVILIER